MATLLRCIGVCTDERAGRSRFPTSSEAEQRANISSGLDVGRRRSCEQLRSSMKACLDDEGRCIGSGFRFPSLVVTTPPGWLLSPIADSGGPLFFAEVVTRWRYWRCPPTRDAPVHRGWPPNGPRAEYRLVADAHMLLMPGQAGTFAVALVQCWQLSCLAAALRQLLARVTPAVGGLEADPATADERRVDWT